MEALINFILISVIIVLGVVSASHYWDSWEKRPGLLYTHIKDFTNNYRIASQGDKLYKYFGDEDWVAKG